MSRLRRQPALPKVLVSPFWRPAVQPVRVRLEKSVLRVASDVYPVVAMSAVHVDSLERLERWQARRRLRRAIIYALPFAVLGIGFIRAGWSYALVGGLFLGVAVVILGSGVGRYINRVYRRPALYRLIAVMAGQRRVLFSCRDHAVVWAVHDGLVKAMSTPAAVTTTTFTINGGQGFQFGNGNTQHNHF